MSLIEKWSIFFRYADNEKYSDKLQEILKSQGGIRTANTLLMSVSQDEKERAHFRSRRMWESDLENNMIVMKEQGLREGLQQGLKQGLKQSAQKMLEHGIEPQKIAEILGISESDLFA